MNSIRRELWGRVFELGISYDYCGDPIPDYIKESVDGLIGSWQSVEDCLCEVKRYCLELDGDLILRDYGIETIENIFRFVMPVSLVGLDTKGKRSVVLCCDYRYDPEEGLAVLFEDEMFKTIDSQSALI